MSIFHLARPKSRILSSQSSLTAMFEGFKSLWIIPAEWTYLGTWHLTWAWIKKNTSCRGLSGRSGTGRGRRRASESWWCCSGQPPSGGSPRLTLLMWSKYKTETYHVNISKLVKGALRCEAVQEANDLKVVYHISHIRKEDVDLKIWDYLVDKFEWSDKEMLISQLTFSWTMCFSILSSL